MQKAKEYVNELIADALQTAQSNFLTNSKDRESAISTIPTDEPLVWAKQWSQILLWKNCDIIKTFARVNALYQIKVILEKEQGWTDTVDSLRHLEKMWTQYIILNTKYGTRGSSLSYDLSTELELCAKAELLVEIDYIVYLGA